MSPLPRRALTVVVGIPLVLGWLWVSFYYERPELVVLLLTGVTGVAAWEYAQLLRKIGFAVPSPLFVGVSIFLVASAGFLDASQAPGLLGVAALIILSHAVMRRWGSAAEGVRTAAGEALGLLYIPFLLQFFYELFREERGFVLVVGLLVLVWAYDTGAFLVGSRWGRRRLAPRLSPGKTWEGVLGGLLLAFLAALGVLGIGEIAPGLSGIVRMGHALGLSLVVSVAAQLGDLFESLLKRAAGVKDAGGLFPGHGGMLDRIDALLFALPVYTLYVRYLLP